MKTKFFTAIFLLIGIFLVSGCFKSEVNEEALSRAASDAIKSSTFFVKKTVQVEEITYEVLGRNDFNPGFGEVLKDAIKIQANAKGIASSTFGNAYYDMEVDFLCYCSEDSCIVWENELLKGDKMEITKDQLVTKATVFKKN